VKVETTFCQWSLVGRRRIAWNPRPNTLEVDRDNLPLVSGRGEQNFVNSNGPYRGTFSDGQFPTKISLF